MESQIKMKSVSLPKILADLTHSNQFLKVFSLGAMGLCGLILALAMILGTKEPIVLTLAPSAALLDRVEMPKPEDEIRMAVRAYLEKRYMWDQTNVTKRLQEAESFVVPSAIKAYQAAVANVAGFSIEKLVAQKVYPEKLDVSLGKRTVVISGERTTTIQGLKAAGELKLELSFESGPRTKSNPWGVCISKEKEE